MYIIYIILLQRRLKINNKYYNYTLNENENIYFISAEKKWLSATLIQ